MPPVPQRHQRLPAVEVLAVARACVVVEAHRPCQQCLVLLVVLHHRLLRRRVEVVVHRRLRPLLVLRLVAVLLHPEAVLLVERVVERVALVAVLLVAVERVVEGLPVVVVLVPVLHNVCAVKPAAVQQQWSNTMSSCAGDCWCTVAIGIAMYDFRAENMDELDLRAGDKVIIISRRTQDAWMEVELMGSGNRGLVPSTYIEEQ
jgi:hypothetical protein